MKNFLLPILFCLPTLLLSQVPFDKISISDDYKGWWARCIADINGDGLKDVVVAKQSRVWGTVSLGSIGWYEAKENGKYLEKKVIENNNLYGSGDLAAADMDKDGDIDIISFEGDETSKDTTARIYWNENPGKGKVIGWKKHLIGSNPEFVKDVEIADFDQDGRLDIASITYWHHSLQIQYQYKKKKFKEGVYMVIPNLHEGMHIGDIDGDKDIDSAANGYWLDNPCKKRNKLKNII